MRVFGRGAGLRGWRAGVPVRAGALTRLPPSLHLQRGRSVLAMRPQQAPVSGKVFIQRDYSSGTRCQFQTKFPAELENRVRSRLPHPCGSGRDPGLGECGPTSGPRRLGVRGLRCRKRVRARVWRREIRPSPGIKRSFLELLRCSAPGICAQRCSKLLTRCPRSIIDSSDKKRIPEAPGASPSRL